MKSCPQCNSKCLNQTVICDCGYVFCDDIAAPAQSSTQEQVKERFAEKASRRTEAFQKRSGESLTLWETVSAAFSGAGLGLLGLLVEWHEASRFSRDGYDLKSKKSWQLYWFSFGVRLAVVAGLFIWFSDWWYMIGSVALWISAFILVRWFWTRERSDETFA
jgi:hypothetical protein